MLKVDLHTHSVASVDGGITGEQYKQALESGILDCIAITDHNTTSFAQTLQQELGAEKIIIGEEISTIEGDIIGLFLYETIPAHLSVRDAIKLIKAQKGIVYIPHPFETVRHGINESVLESIKDQVDIIESANGRAYFQNFGPKAHSWAHMSRKATAASSDAHRVGGLGKTFTSFPSAPTADSIVALCGQSRKTYKRPSLADILAPKMNKLTKKVRMR